MATNRKTPGASPKTPIVNDDRLRRNTAPNVRGGRGVAEDAARTDETGLVDNLSELQAMLASEFDQVALPTPPQIPGWHCCWLTTSSTYDSVQKRMRLGFVPVTAEDLPGFEVGGQSSAQFGGAISCNEMVLFKIASDRYNAIMNLFHHRRPMEEETGVYAKVEQIAGDEDSSGRQLVEQEGDGFDQLAKNIKRATQLNPVFEA